METGSPLVLALNTNCSATHLDWEYLQDMQQWHDCGIKHVERIKENVSTDKAPVDCSRAVYWLLTQGCAHKIRPKMTVDRLRHIFLKGWLN